MFKKFSLILQMMYLMLYSNLRRVLIENFLLDDLTRIITKTKESHNFIFLHI